MEWLFGKKKRAQPDPILAERAPRDDERLGPAPPPEPTRHAPRVTVVPFAGAPSASPVLLGELSPSRPGRTLVMRAGSVPCLVPGEAGVAISALALSPATLHDRMLAPGDLLYPGTGSGVSLSGPDGTMPPLTAALLLDVARGAGDAGASIREGELVGRGIPGITGIRVLRRTASCATLRLGPPPGARWVLVGLRAFALFAGAVTAVDGEDMREVRPGQLAVVGDATATLYLQTGNDSAMGIGFAAPDVVVALG